MFYKPFTGDSILPRLNGYSRLLHRAPRRLSNHLMMGFSMKPATSFAYQHQW
jgi:hypothetical protein